MSKAMFAGLEYTEGDCCVVIDYDLQHLPGVIFDMYCLWMEGYEVVEGVKTVKILIIIPAYNEQANIKKVLDDISKYAPEMDYLVVNDCSKDHTLEILQHSHSKYIDLPINLGIGGGVQTGYLYAYKYNYDIAVQLDGDGQHNAEYLNALISPIINAEANIVIGSRYISKEGFQSSCFRRMGIKFLSNLIKICTGTKISDVTSGFRAVDKKMIDLFAKEYAEDYPEPEAIVLAAKKGAKIMEVPVIMNERTAGRSSITGFKTIYYMVKVSLSILLLQISLGGGKIKNDHTKAKYFFIYCDCFLFYMYNSSYKKGNFIFKI